METVDIDKSQFFLRNLLRGVGLFTVTIVGYLAVKHFFGFDLKSMMGPLYESPNVVFSIFLFSEVVFGLIPPEFFMIWSLRHGDLEIFISNMFILMIISYLAGILGYWFGAYMNGTRAYGFLRDKIFGKFEKYFNEYGGFLVIVGALTPIPFSGICMLVGSVRYPFARFLVVSMVRFVRFSIYAYIIWKAQIV